MISLPRLIGAAAILASLGAAGLASAGDDAQAKKYDIVATATPEAISAGASARYSITITPRPGFVMKVDTPFKAKLTSDTGVEITKDTFGREDFDDPKAPAKSVSTSFKAPKAGENRIIADITFFVCNDALCERFKEQPTLTFAVK